MTVQVDETRDVPIEDAIDRTGFGVYSLLYVLLTGLTIIAFACVTYSATYIVPTSACELSTTIGQQGIIAAAPIVGLSLGGPFWGMLGDNRGRRNSLILSLVSTAVINLVTSISVNWVMLLIFQLLATIASSGQLMVGVALLCESVPMAKRNLSVLLVTTIFLLSQGVMAMIALGIVPLSFSFYIPALGIYWNSWRTLQAVYSVPCIIMAICFCFMTESPKFHYRKGDEAKALETLKTIHRRNFRGKNEEYQVKTLLKSKSLEVKERPPFKEQFMPLFKAPLLKNVIIVTLLQLLEGVGSMQIWFPTILNQFMQMLGTGAPMTMTLCEVLKSSSDAIPDPDAVPCSLNQTAMLVVLGSAVLQSALNIIITLVVDKLGARNLVMFLTTFCGVSGILVSLVPNTIVSAVLYMIFLQGYLVTGLYIAISVAVFPTNIRAFASALTMSFGRLGTIASIQILNYLRDANCEAGFYIFATLFVLSAVVASFLPDDRPVRKERNNDDTISTDL